MIRPEKAEGPDNIKAKDFSMIGDSLPEGLQGMFKGVMCTKQLLCNWKNAKLKVAYNYRLLSMLSIVSKIFETD